MWAKNLRREEGYLEEDYSSLKEQQCTGSEVGAGQYAACWIISEEAHVAGTELGRESVRRTEIREVIGLGCVELYSVHKLYLEWDGATTILWCLCFCWNVGALVGRICVVGGCWHGWLWAHLEASSLMCLVPGLGPSSQLDGRVKVF